MRFHKYIFLLVVLMLCSLSYANQNAFEEANKAFEEQDFEEALQLYKGLANAHPNQYELHFNLANTYYHLDSLAQSVLHYEKALKFNPGNERAWHNLQLCYLKSDYAIEPLPQVFFVVWWEQYLAWFSLNDWAKLTVLLVWLGILSFFIHYFRKKGFLKFSGYVFLTLGFWLVFTTAQKAKALKSQDYAIVMVPSLSLQTGPDGDKESVADLHEGMKVELLDSLDDWLRVKLDEETEGWVLREGVSPI